MHLRILFVSALLILTFHSNASGLIPFENLSPIIGQLPQATYPSNPQNQKSNWVYSIEATTANYISSRSDNGVTYYIDGETTLVSQSLAYQLDESTIGILLPWQNHGNGVLDRPIYDFHDFFGMPQNGRTDSNIENLSWSLSQNGNQQYLLESSKQALGDIELFIETSPSAFDSTALRFGVQLPTGNSNARSSADAWGVALSSLTNESIIPSPDSILPPLSYWYGVGLNYVSDTDEVSFVSQHNIVASGVAGLGIDVSKTWGLNAQLNANTPYFDTEIRELGWVPIILSVGADIYFLRNKLMLGFSEDLRPNTSPDFSVYFSWTHYFNE